MGEARHDGRGVALGLRDQRGLEQRDIAVEPVDRLAHVEPEIGRHLVVARARGMEAPGGRTDQLGEPRFDVEMDVLVFDAERKGAALDRAADGAETPGNGVAVFP